MSYRIWRLPALALVAVLAYLGLAVPVSARPDRPNAKASTPVHALGTARPVGPTASRAGATLGTRATTILGSAWTANNAPIAQARLRLRNVISGRVEATTIANEAGQFAFENVEGGSYLVELVNEAGKIQVVGHIFTIAQGETVATFVRLGGTKVPWFAGFFNNSVMAVSASAASGGIAAIAPVTRPVSANQ
jgi:hypothetical protein